MRRWSASVCVGDAVARCELGADHRLTSQFGYRGIPVERVDAGAR